MIHWNPVPHVQHAWSDAHTVWGKIALVLFYALIWIGILSSAWNVVVPASFWNDCFLDMDKHEEVRDVMVSLVRGGDLILIGFLFYADVGGLKVKNVAMVFIFITAMMLSYLPLYKVAECAAAWGWFWFWLYPMWALLALIFIMVDDKMADRGTAEENTSLTV